MHTDSGFQRITAFILVGTLFLFGLPRPSSAAGDERRIGVPHQALTLNGQPLAQLLNATAITRGAFRLDGPLAQGTGQITGVALDGDGQSATGETVQLRRVGPPTEVVDSTTTDANGRFSFAALGAGRYIVDLRMAGKVVATSGFVSLAEGGMTFIQVGGVADQQSTSDNEKGKGALFWTAVGAGVGAGVGAAACLADPTASDPSNLCWGVVPGMGAIMGAFMGLFFGAGR